MKLKLKKLEVGNAKEENGLLVDDNLANVIGGEISIITTAVSS